MGSTIALTPLYSRAPKGERAVGSVPRNWQTNTTLIGALTLSGIEVAMTLDGAVDSAAFEAFVEHILCLQLRAGQVIVLDNLVHFGSNVPVV